MKFEKDKAHYALEGMPPSKTADTLSGLEDLYYDYDRGTGVAAEWPSRLVWRWPFSEIAWPIIRLLRDQVRTLALAYAELDSAQNADHIQALKYQDLLKLMGEPQALGYYLVKNFQSEVSGFPKDITYAEMAIRIMKDLKEQLESERSRT